MNKKKTPVLLFGLIVVAIASMVVFNANSRPVDPEAPAPGKEDVHGSDLSEADRTKAANDVLSGLPDSSDKTRKDLVPVGKPGSSGSGQQGMATEPTILVKKYIAVRPKPSDGSTSTQWYNGRSRAARITEENN
ncbi:MAG: hypothetical protein JNM34_05640 [Chthonomonadaceae bacterium]|jgi:hypothetical protein|nr:hypothetical protein [Chthonomonadaceae bacterium]